MTRALGLALLLIAGCPAEPQAEITISDTKASLYRDIALAKCESINYCDRDVNVGTCADDLWLEHCGDGACTQTCEVSNGQWNTCLRDLLATDCPHVDQGEWPTECDQLLLDGCYSTQ